MSVTIYPAKGYTYNYKYQNKLIYIGSTFNEKHRKVQHKSRLNNNKQPHYNQPFYIYLRDNNLTFDDLVYDSTETNITKLNQDDKVNDLALRKLEGELQRIHFDEITNCRKECKTKDENKEQKKESYHKNKELHPRVLYTDKQKEEAKKKKAERRKERDAENRKNMTEAELKAKRDAHNLISAKSYQKNKETILQKQAAKKAL